VKFATGCLPLYNVAIQRTVRVPVEKGKMAHLAIYLLGPLRVTIDEEPVAGFESNKVRALLAYLAVEAGQPQRRETLAGLLWPDWPERSARTNLRRALTNLRSAIGDRARSEDRVAIPQFLHVSRQTIQFNTASDAWVDVTAFTRLVGTKSQADAKHPSEQAIERLEEAVALYQGLFLDGFSLADSPAFDDWVLLTRERLHRQVTDALCRLAKCHEQRGDCESALHHAWRQVELDPWRERAHRQVMRLLTLSGQRGAALAQYETCCRLLAEELGVEPATETTQLYRQIRDGVLEALPSPPHSLRHNLPAQATPFVGRETTLAKIKQRLEDPDYRLLTLIGPGGSGKTRLALEAAAAQLENYTHGVFFVPLAPLRSVEAIVPTVAQAIGFSFHAAGNPELQSRQQLLDYLSQKCMLLVLDSFEHLLAPSAPERENGVGVVTAILNTAPEVKLLVTSRATLDVEGECQFPIGGMDFPDALPRGITDLSRYDAVELFASGARRAWPGFELTADNVADVVRICRLVSGMPLGILLAAAWGQMLSPAEIADQIGRGIDFLETHLRDVPARQRSERAVFDHSWGLLTEREHEVFQALSIFRGGSTRQAAQEITGASLRELMALVNKSLLHRAPTGRYEIHELLRQYAAEKLAESPIAAEAAYDNHCAYYMAALQQWATDLKGRRQQEALSEMDVEIENARAAWDWAVAQGQIARLSQAMDGLCLFYARRGRYQEGASASCLAAEGLQKPVSADGSAPRVSSSMGEELRIQARALTWQGVFSMELGRTKLAIQLLRQSLALLEGPELAGQDTRAEKASALTGLGAVAGRSDLERAGRLYEQSLALYRALDDQWEIGGVLCALGSAVIDLGDYDEARRLCEESLAIRRELTDRWGVADSLYELGRVALFLGELGKTERLMWESIAILEEIGDQAGVAKALNVLGAMLPWSGKFTEARSLLERSVEICRDLEFRDGLVDALVFLSTVDAHLGAYESMRSLAQESHLVAEEIGYFYGWGYSLILLGVAALIDAEYDKAERFFQESVAIYEKSGHQDARVFPLAYSAVAALKLGRRSRVRQRLCDALRMASALGGLYPLMYALAAIALFLADEGQAERATELYALVSRYPLMAKSRWFEDVVGQHVAAAAALAPGVIAAAQKRGKALDPSVTAAALLEELA
jgi:predicted ATPase